MPHLTDARVRVVSNHPLVPSAVRRMLSKDPSLGLRLESSPAPAVKGIGDNNPPSLVILDTCSLPEAPEPLCRFVRIRYPKARLLALLHPDKCGEEEVLRLLFCGVEGCVPMTPELEAHLAPAVRAVLGGEVWAPRKVLRKYVFLTSTLIRAETDPHPGLTAREDQILHLLLRRMSNKEIGNILSISERTAKFHVSNILAKLGVEKRDQLTELAEAA